MATALETWLKKKGYSELVLIGYSGGGALAMLLAERIRVRAVITVAANLDISEMDKLARIYTSDRFSKSS